VAVARSLGTPLFIHQPAYSLVNREAETGLFEALEETGLGSIAFVPLAQGLLTSRFIDDPRATHATDRPSFDRALLSEDNLRRLRGLNDIAAARGQSLAQMAIAWVLRPGAATSALIGVSAVEQLDENLGALDSPSFSTGELAAIDELAGKAGTNTWMKAEGG
jgi:L-glyceraldehyde 3-phosphate reductase